MKRKFVVIGGAAAGPKCASKLRRLDPNADIKIIQKGRYLSMASCGYPYFIGGVFDEKSKLIATPAGAIRNPDFFASTKDIEAITNTEVIAIDRVKKTVIARNLDTSEQTEHSYDKLMIAVGSSPIFPKLPGHDLDGVTTLHDINNALYIKEKVKSGTIKKAVIIGGGLIGIETAEAFGLAGIDVTIVEKLDEILPFLDPELGLLVRQHIESCGARVLTGNSAVAFHGTNGRVNAVELSNGEILPCDIAVMSIGVRPNSQLAADAGLKIGDTGGIATNIFMQTSDPDIYAAGDCVEITDLVTHRKVHWPMGDAANLQGRVAAQNMHSGNHAEYDGAVMTGICKVFDYGVGSTGMSERRARTEGYTNYLTVVHASPDKPGFMSGKPLIIKMIANKTTCKLLGVQIIGPGDVSKRLATAAMAIHAGMHISELITLDLPYAPPFSLAIDSFIAAAHAMENKWLGLMEGISTLEVKSKLDRGEKPFLLDARSPQEYEQMRLEMGEHLIPLGKLKNSPELPKDKTTEIIAYCKISLRGYEAYCTLRGMGYTNVKVMEGGLVAWPFGLKQGI